MIPWGRFTGAAGEYIHIDAVGGKLLDRAAIIVDT